MSNPALVDRIERELEDAIRHARGRRRRAYSVRALVLLGALTAGAGTAVAFGVGPFDRLFANDSASRPAADPGTIRVDAPTTSSGVWSVIAYRRRDGAIGLSAATDRESRALPPVSWMGAPGLDRAFQKLGPVSVHERRTRGTRKQAWLLYGLIEHGARGVSVSVEGRGLRVHQSRSELSLPLADARDDPLSRELTVRVFAAPIDRVSSGQPATAEVMAIAADGTVSRQRVALTR